MLTFSTNGLPPHQRFDQWREERDRQLIGVTIEMAPDRRADFRGHFSARQAGTQRSTEASFQQLANTGFTVFGARATTHTALGSFGIELRLATGTRLTASLDGELGDRHRSLRANAGISHSW
ncbi:hypothetical protein [Phreatobacter sp.]|uniref:hypothetical protein n=1 Tax=Phreatobacter sp. TaxID=1966341 RepID=UPI0022C42F24|nr:hypothetical protein [Phreatobacter sp.]MCZ8317030.1 hypothetical protein [Phreatobacter sp.]